jgi:hypothetical protein
VQTTCQKELIKKLVFTGYYKKDIWQTQENIAFMQQSDKKNNA